MTKQRSIQKSTQAWHRQYRPRQVAGLHSQSMRGQLLKMLKASSFPTTLLLTGPKGTGKTTTARLLAAVLNDPANEAAVKARFGIGESAKAGALQDVGEYPELAAILDGRSGIVHELDAASNRGIDDVRQLRERAYLPAQFGLIQVFILDEAHMLTPEASNALLKILEEPPAQTVFILATTDADRLLPTILSRTTIFEFTKPTAEEVVTALQNVAAAEQLTVDEAALEALVGLAGGSFRDAVKWLETASYQADKGQITVELVRQVARVVPDEALHQLLQAVLNHQPAAVMSWTAEWRLKQVSSIDIWQGLVAWLHHQLSLHYQAAQTAAVSPTIATYLLKTFLAQPPYQREPIPLLQLEVTLLDLIARAKRKTAQPTPPAGTELPAAESPAADKAPSPTKTSQPSPVPESLASTTVLQTVEVGEVTEHWPVFKREVIKEFPTLALILQSAQPQVTEVGELQIGVGYQLHSDRLTSAKVWRHLQTVASLVWGKAVTITVVILSADRAADQRASDLVAEALL